MLVTSELDHDPRVQKEALSAHRAGYDVTVLCRAYDGPELPYRVIALGAERRSTRFMKYAERATVNLRFAALAIQRRPSIIHANDLDTLPAAFIASRVCGARLLYDSHELWCGASRDVGSVGKRVAFVTERTISQRADAVVTVSDHLARRMGELLGIAKPTVVMNSPWFVPDAELTEQPWVRDYKDRKRVLHQGRYVAGRGILEAILAARHLPEEVILLFRGFGPLEGEMRDLVRRERLDERVHFLPAVAMNELVQSAVGAHIGLVLYARTNENNSFAAPNKLFEFIMAGVPCVGTDMPFLREVLEGGELGAVFKERDPEDLARVITDLLAKPARLDTMKQRCRDAARAFAWEAEAAKLLGEYERLARS
jgi:glycosyltransferase involved in cell wall biosynthesis